MIKKSKLNMAVITAIMVMGSVTGCASKATSDMEVVVQTEIAQQPEHEQSQEAEESTKSSVEDEKVEDSAPEKSNESVLSEDMFQVTVKGTTVKLGGDMIANQETMGEADDYSAAKSCLGTGEDKTFTYGDVTIYTKPIDGMDKIYLIEISENTTVAGGISIGSSLEELQAVYGTSEEIEGIEHFYVLGDKTIGFEIENDEVTYIEIFGED